MIIVVTRKSEPNNSECSEWGKGVWGFYDKGIHFKCYKSGQAVANVDAADLVVIKGGAPGIRSLIAKEVREHLCGDTTVYVHCNGLALRREELGLLDAVGVFRAYTLGDDNNPPANSWGACVIELARIIRGSSNEKSSPDTGDPGGGAARGTDPYATYRDKAEKVSEGESMGRLFSVIAPLCVADGNEIEGVVRTNLANLNGAAINVIVSAVRKERKLMCALGDLIKQRKWDDVVAWIKSNRPQLPSLAGRYL